MVERRNLIDGTGGCWAIEALAEATRSRQAAEADEAETWSHLLVEAMAEVMAETDERRLYEKLGKVDAVTRRWRSALRGRIAGTTHGPRCLCAECNPDAAGFHNAKLALN